jgi:hypothetical protein
MTQTQIQTSPRPDDAFAFSDGGRLASRAEAGRVARMATAVGLDGEPGWPSECERLALINAGAGQPPTIGERYLLEAFFMTPGPQGVAAVGRG